jgi:hypothetical protein
MQSRGVTEKAYVEQCKGGTEPTAATPAAKAKHGHWVQNRKGLYRRMARG